MESDIKNENSYRNYQRPPITPASKLENFKIYLPPARTEEV